jgi:alkylation response protein AidB-like acyl-CoA dehydrogenase
MFFIPFSLPGITRSRFQDMGGIPLPVGALITFNDVRIPISFRLENEGEGFTKVMHSFDFVRGTRHPGRCWNG